MLDYAGERDRLLAAFADRERRKVHGGGKKPPTEKALATARNKAFGTTLPLRLVDALMLDTSDYQRFGWSRPPASRELVYLRRPLTPTPRLASRKVPATDDRARLLLRGSCSRDIRGRASRML